MNVLFWGLLAAGWPALVLAAQIELFPLTAGSPTTLIVPEDRIMPLSFVIATEGTLGEIEIGATAFIDRNGRTLPVWVLLPNESLPKPSVEARPKMIPKGTWAVVRLYAGAVPAAGQSFAGTLLLRREEETIRRYPVVLIAPPQSPTDFQADAEAVRGIQKAKTLFDAGDYKAAGTTYDAVTQRRASVSPALVETAVSGKVDSELAQIREDHPGFWEALLRGFRSMWSRLSEWVLIGAPLVLLVWAIRRLMPPKRGIQVSMEDISATDRPTGARVLSQEMTKALQAGEAVDGFEFRAMQDMEGASFGSVRPLLDLGGFDQVLSSTAVNVGPFSLTPKALWAALTGVFERSYEQTFAGTLATRGSQIVLTVQLLDRRGRIEEYWQAEVTSDKRQEAIQSIAARLITRSQRSTVTTSAESLCSLRLGIAVLQDGTSMDTLRAAAAHFRASLARDPGNWMARFNLSVVLRQLGDSVTAIEHCSMLAERINAGDLAGALLIQPHLEVLNQYNLALAESKSGSWDGYWRARKVFDDLIESRLADFQMMGLSGKATSLVFEYQRLREQPSGDADQARRRQEKIGKVIGQVDECGERLEGLRTTTPRRDAAFERRLELSLAIALNAQGYILEQEGAHQRALMVLRRAAALQPEFVEPHLNLARLFRHRGIKAGGDWTEQARMHLDRALAINPSNRDAKYQMGRLLMDPSLAQYAKALEFFQSAQPHGMSAFQAGMVFLNPAYGEANLGKAIEWLRLSNALTRSVGFQHQILTENLLKDVAGKIDAASEAIETGTAPAAVVPAPTVAAPTPGLALSPAAGGAPSFGANRRSLLQMLEAAEIPLDEAHRTAQALEKRADRPVLQKRGTAFLSDIQRLRKQIVELKATVKGERRMAVNQRKINSAGGPVEIEIFAGFRHILSYRCVLMHNDGSNQQEVLKGDTVDALPDKVILPLAASSLSGLFLAVTGILAPVQTGGNQNFSLEIHVRQDGNEVGGAPVTIAGQFQSAIPVLEHVEL